jgi:hypothetical protein
MEPFTRVFTDDLLGKLDKALTDHPDECPLEDMKPFAVEYRDEPRVSPSSCSLMPRTSRPRLPRFLRILDNCAMPPPRADGRPAITRSTTQDFTA